MLLMQKTDPQPLTEPRSLEQRQIGNCRDFTVLLTSILRYQGVPARARCGFGTYFLPNHFEDHWVCEYWNADQERWILVDAQLDEFQCDEMKVPFDPLDVPRDQFVVAGKPGRCAVRDRPNHSSLVSLSGTAGGLSGEMWCGSCWPSTKLNSCPGT